MKQTPSTLFVQPDRNLETFSTVWLINSTGKISTDSRVESPLRQTMNLVKTFDDPEICERYLLSLTKDDRIIFILSAPFDCALLHRVHQFQQIVSIYIHSLKKEQYSQWHAEFDKVRSVSEDIDVLVSDIQSNYSRRNLVAMNEPFAITVSVSSADSDRSTTKLNGQFVHSQLLIDCLLRMKSKPSDKDALVGYFRTVYHDNKHALAFLDEFKRDYSSDRALWWYTRESFIYRVLNKALRTQNTDILFLFGFFIQDLQSQLQRYKCSSPVSAFRAQLMADEELQLLKASIGNFISLHSFLSTSIERRLALFYLDGSSPSQGFQRVLWEIQLDPQLDGTKPFANITEYSSFPEEKEVLIMLGSIFRFKDMYQEKGIWIIQVELCSNQNSDVKLLFEHLKHQHGDGETNLLSFGVVLHEMGKFDDAEKYYHRLVNENPDNQELISACYHALGSVASERGDYDTSLAWNYQSLDIRKQATHVDEINLAYNYNSIGVIYQKKSEYGRALEFYHQALMIWKRVFGRTDLKVATCLNNMGGAYHAEERYNEALQYHQQALSIWQTHLPANCVDLGASHNNIGCIYGCLRDYSQAMRHFNQSLEIYEKSLPSEHAAVAKTLENIGLVHYFKEETEQALLYYTKAATLYSRTLPCTHPKLAKIQQDIECVLSGKMPSSFHFWWLDTLKVL